MWCDNENITIIINIICKIRVIYSHKYITVTQ